MPTYDVRDIPKNILLATLYNLAPKAKNPAWEPPDAATMTPQDAEMVLEGKRKHHPDIDPFVDSLFGRTINIRFGDTIDTDAYDAVTGRNKGLMAIFVARNTTDPVEQRMMEIAKAIQTLLPDETIGLELGVAAPEDDEGNLDNGIAISVVLTRFAQLGPPIQRIMMFPVATPGTDGSITFASNDAINAFFDQIATMSKGAAVDIVANPNLN